MQGASEYEAGSDSHMNDWLTKPADMTTASVQKQWQKIFNRVHPGSVYKCNGRMRTTTFRKTRETSDQGCGEP